MSGEDSSFELTGEAADSVARMRAAGEPTRIRLLALLEQVDLTVSDIVEITGQSQPRLSRHLKLLVEAGLATRVQEGAWAYFRTVDSGAARALLDTILEPLASSSDPTLRADREGLQAVLERRDARAAEYFAANASQWGRIRAMHIEEQAVETAMLDLGLSLKPKGVLDLGTGTGRILQLFAPHITRGVGIDISNDMLSVARASMAGEGYAHIQLRHGNVYDLGTGGSYDLIVMHQVVHFLEDPATSFQAAAGRLSDQGRLLIVDFLPHSIDELRDQHAHRRLGIDPQQLAKWLDSAGLVLETEQLLPAPQDDDMSLTVALWMAHKSMARKA
ncbi:MAG: metalloregulator ArsR/SmtB family transcription factor [Ahrensia sp.]|nr:metalloregulator ArsR/SmtB family transcription factor [Ahrensia sp.]